MDKIIAAIVVLLAVIFMIRLAWTKSNTWKCPKCGSVNDNSNTECIKNCKF